MAEITAGILTQLALVPAASAIEKRIKQSFMNRCILKNRQDQLNLINTAQAISGT